MARIEEIERRLLNWARWKSGGRSSGMGYATVNLGASPGGTRQRESVIPTIDCEAEETDRAVMSLPSELRATVEAVYVSANSARGVAARLCVTPAAVDARIWRAHSHIQAWLQTLESSRKAERERVEFLQRASKR